MKIIKYKKIIDHFNDPSNEILTSLENEIYDSNYEYYNLDTKTIITEVVKNENSNYTQ